MARKSPQLLYKLEGHSDEVLSVAFLPDEEGIISTGADKSIRVWLKRDNNQFWPSICHFASHSCTALAYDKQQRRLFVGLSSGVIIEFLLSEDYNRMDRKLVVSAHSGYIEDIVYCSENDWLLSCGRDKYLKWHCCQTGKLLGSLRTSAWCTRLAYDTESKLVFVADFSGIITILRLEAAGKLKITNSLNGHSGSVQALCWDTDRKRLMSAGFDQTIIIWDIGGGNGQTCELNGHYGKITVLYYSPLSKKMISACDTKHLSIWDMTVDRTDTPKWEQNDICQLCSKPFIFCIKESIARKEMWVRQHHCRHCGKAVCDKCSDHSSRIPSMGFEKAVRICTECMQHLNSDASLVKPTSGIYDIGTVLKNVDLDINSSLMVGCSGDKIIRVWDMKSFI